MYYRPGVVFRYRRSPGYFSGICSTNPEWFQVQDRPGVASRYMQYRPGVISRYRRDQEFSGIYSTDPEQFPGNDEPFRYRIDPEQFSGVGQTQIIFLGIGQTQKSFQVQDRPKVVFRQRMDSEQFPLIGQTRSNFQLLDNGHTRKSCYLQDKH